MFIYFLLIWWKSIDSFSFQRYEYKWNTYGGTFFNYTTFWARYFHLSLSCTFSILYSTAYVVRKKWNSSLTWLQTDEHIISTTLMTSGVNGLKPLCEKSLTSDPKLVLYTVYSIDIQSFFSSRDISTKILNSGFSQSQLFIYTTVYIWVTRGGGDRRYQWEWSYIEA